MRKKRKWCQACHRSVVGTKRVRALGYMMNLCLRCRISAQKIANASREAKARKIHVVDSFVGGCPLTKCGRYVDIDNVTAFVSEATCGTCS